jgi:hypothetical protein
MTSLAAVQDPCAVWIGEMTLGSRPRFDISCVGGADSSRACSAFQVVARWALKHGAAKQVVTRVASVANVSKNRMLVRRGAFRQLTRPWESNLKFGQLLQ